VEYLKLFAVLFVFGAAIFGALLFLNSVEKKKPRDCEKCGKKDCLVIYSTTRPQGYDVSNPSLEFTTETWRCEECLQLTEIQGKQQPFQKPPLGLSEPKL